MKQVQKLGKDASENLNISNKNFQKKMMKSKPLNIKRKYFQKPKYQNSKKNI